LNHSWPSSTLAFVYALRARTRDTQTDCMRDGQTGLVMRPTGRPHDNTESSPYEFTADSMPYQLHVMYILKTKFKNNSTPSTKKNHSLLSN